MSDLGWLKKKIKWGGKEFTRAIWIKKGFSVGNGNIFGPKGYEQGLVKHLDNPDLFDDVTPKHTFDQSTVDNGEVY